MVATQYNNMDHSEAQYILATIGCLIADAYVSLEIESEHNYQALNMHSDIIIILSIMPNDINLYFGH